MITTAKLKRAKSLLTKLRSAELRPSFYDDDLKIKLERSEKILTVFRDKSLNQFDILRKIGFRADENRFSDAVAALLDPKGGHQLGVLPLKKLLERITAKHHPARSNASKILSLLEQNQSHISVRREKPEMQTRLDIEIVGIDFIIFIENKIRGGRETLHKGGQSQTRRQWKVLEGKSKYLDVSVLGVFLSPEGKSAIDKNFIPLSVNELVSCLREAVDASEKCPCKHSIQAFLDFYAWE